MNGLLTVIDRCSSRVVFDEYDDRGNMVKGRACNNPAFQAEARVWAAAAAVHVNAYKCYWNK